MKRARKKTTEPDTRKLIQHAQALLDRYVAWTIWDRLAKELARVTESAPKRKEKGR